MGMQRGSHMCALDGRQHAVWMEIPQSEQSRIFFWFMWTLDLTFEALTLDTHP